MNKRTDFIKLDENKDFGVRSLDAVCINESHLKHPWWFNFKYLLVGIAFWYRIGKSRSYFMVSYPGNVQIPIVSYVWHHWICRHNGYDFRLVDKEIQGQNSLREAIEFHAKKFNKGNVYGALLFGLGWALTGACPGPLFAQIGTGAFVIVVTLVSAIGGTWIYGLLREKLPH